MHNQSETYSSIRKPSLVIRAGKWIGLLLCVALLILFVVSLRLSFMWISRDNLAEIDITEGQFIYAWRAEGWQLAGKYCGLLPVGWCVDGNSSTYTYASPKWQIELYTNSCWVGYGVPIWIPFVILAPFTALFWYIDFKRVKTAFCRWMKRLCPILEKRVTVKLVSIFALIHAVLTITVFRSFFRFVILFFPPLDNLNYRILDDVVMWTWLVLFLGSPIWGLLEAWGYVRFSNWLLSKNPSHNCKKCGYNLTGNISGRCPECGTQLLPNQNNGDLSKES